MKKEDVYVVSNYGTTDIGDLYLSKSDAEIVCDKENKSLFDYYRKRYKKITDEELEISIRYMKYKVMSLADAIDMIIEYVKECSTEDDESL